MRRDRPARTTRSGSPTCSIVLDSGTAFASVAFTTCCFRLRYVLLSTSVQTADGKEHVGDAQLVLLRSAATIWSRRLSTSASGRAPRIIITIEKKARPWRSVTVVRLPECGIVSLNRCLQV